MGLLTRPSIKKMLLLIPVVFVLLYLRLAYVFLFPSNEDIDELLSSRLETVLLSEYKIRNYKAIEKVMNSFGKLKYPEKIIESTNCERITPRECRIKNVFYSALLQCNESKTYCMLMEDDILLFSYTKQLLYWNLIAWSNDSRYIMDCNKFGLYRYNYEVNGNGLQCRIYSKFLIEELKHCLINNVGAADLILPRCLKGIEEKRFLAVQNGNMPSVQPKP
ncbi:hypothetical protein K502DRAFT_346180 [Neoconidiobolus thromboides FSU 785]|nr:hypothetical protein K502DRAFT_346180 [Neoconidiobolus thromboides FSU 785]